MAKILISLIDAFLNTLNVSLSKMSPTLVMIKSTQLSFEYYLYVIIIKKNNAMTKVHTPRQECCQIESNRCENQRINLLADLKLIYFVFNQTFSLNSSN